MTPALDSPPVGTAPAGSARERLLRAANELFYAEGINTVGIDRIIERAGVAKASLYSTFGSKDELIRAYLMDRHEIRRARIERHRAAASDARGRMLAVFHAQVEAFNEPGWAGCPFLAATGEARTDAVVREVSAVMRSYTRGCWVSDARELGVEDPEGLAGQMAMLYDGAVVAFQLEGDRGAPDRALAMAESLLR